MQDKNIDTDFKFTYSAKEHEKIAPEMLRLSEELLK